MIFQSHAMFQGLVPTMTESTNTEEQKGIDRSGFLNRNDQRTIMWVVALCFLIVVVMFGMRFVRSDTGKGQVSHIDQLPNQEIAFQVDLNRADWTELSSLPNIGEIMARRIVEYRQVHGPFQSLSQLTEVEGIGPNTLATIRPLLCNLPAETSPVFVSDSISNTDSDPTIVDRELFSTKTVSTRSVLPASTLK